MGIAVQTISRGTLPSMEGYYVALIGIMVVLLGVGPSIATGLNTIANEAGNAVLSVIGG